MHSIEQLILQRLEKKAKKAVRRTLKPGDTPALDPGFLYQNRRVVAALLARAVENNAFVLSPLKKLELSIDGKQRTIYRPAPLDALLAGVYADAMSEAFEPQLSPRVFSYRKGHSSHQILRELQAFLNRHRCERPNPMDRGLYVLKRDISAYGESIPTVKSSRLWELIDAAVASSNNPVLKHSRQLLNQMIRPEVILPDGSMRTLETGTPTGSPIQPPICNLYLTDLDKRLEKIAGSFYARFGDDFIFAHPDADTTRNTAGIIDRIVADLGLKMGPDKKKNFYLNGAGRPSVLWPETIATPHIEHLGCRVTFSGGITLKRDKMQHLLQNLRNRIHNTVRMIPHESDSAVLDAVCAVVNEALHPNFVANERSAQLLRQAVDDRSWMKHIDYVIALEIAKAVSGRRTAKAFRYTSYRTLRERHGLISLTQRACRVSETIRS